MKSGRILQVAEPLELYRNPGNMFAAGFIGSPAMNFFEGQLVRENGRLAFVWASEAGQSAVHFPLNEAQEKLLTPYLGTNVVMGLRPEHFSESPSGVPLSAVVEGIELMGADSHVYLKNGIHRFIARLQGISPRAIGHSIPLFADLSRACFFQAEPKAGHQNGTHDFDVESWQAASRRIV